VLVVDAEIRPEPTAEERDAILRALEEQVARDHRPPAYRSAWRDQGIRENADDADPEDPFSGWTGRPRKRPGATRA
jgi:hypothetical protein